PAGTLTGTMPRRVAAEVAMGPDHFPLHILIVDDYAPTASIMASLLRLWGHHPLAAATAAEALRLAEARRPDVVLLDVCLPDMSGWELARELARRPQARNALLIAVTG